MGGGKGAREAAPGAAPGWEAVDATPDPRAYVDHLRAANASPQYARYKERSFALLELAPDASVLDAGCGLGDEVRALAARVPSGRVLGVDASATMLAEARRLGVPANAEFRVGALPHLDLPAASFDAVRADRVLQHVEDPAAAVGELVRVTRPGGRVVLADQDWGSRSVASDDVATTRRILEAWSRELHHGLVGRRLRELLVAAGLRDTAVEGHTLVYLSPDTEGQGGLEASVAAARAEGSIDEAQGARWLAEMRRRGAEGTYFASLLVVIASARKA